MKIAVVDTSAFVACLFADGRARFALQHTNWALYAPPFLLEETARILPKVETHLGPDADLVHGLLDMCARRIEVLPKALYAAHLAEARRLVADVDPNDDEYVALALALDAPIWTHDEDFGRIPAIRTVQTFELVADL